MLLPETLTINITHCFYTHLTASLGIHKRVRVRLSAISCTNGGKMPRTKGSRNRNYPPVPLAEALAVPSVIEDQASGMPVSRLTLAELLHLSPSSSQFRELVAAARQYGLTSGGINSVEFGLTELGRDATGADEDARVAALRTAVTNIDPFRIFLSAFNGKKVPGDAAFREFLAKSAGVPLERASECMRVILADAETAGLVRPLKGGSYVELDGMIAPADPYVAHQAAPVNEKPGEVSEVAPELEPGSCTSPARRPDTTDVLDRVPKKVFIAHGSNRTPLEQLKKALDQFKVAYAVAVDEPNKGRPISKKVAQLMRDECSSGIFIFTADEHFTRKAEGGETVDVWRPRENVVYELGAASILYENRIVIFKERGVAFPSDFSDLGHIEFEKDQLVAEIGSLFGELVALDILEVRAKG